MMDFAIHRFFPVFENSDKLLRCFCAVDVHLERFSFFIKVLRIIFPNLHSFLTSQDEVTPFRPDTQQNSFTLDHNNQTPIHRDNTLRYELLRRYQ